MTDCRIYVASLSDYNAGRLHGVWIDLDGKDLEDVQAEVSAMLRASRYPNVTVEHFGKQVPSAEEYAIHDHEGFPDGYVQEYTPLGDLVETANALEELEDYQRVGFRFLLWNDTSLTPAEALEKAEEVRWTTESPAEAVASFWEETSSEVLDALPEELRHRIDWEGVAHDWQQNGELCTFDDPEEGRVTILGNPNA